MGEREGREAKIKRGKEGREVMEGREREKERKEGREREEDRREREREEEETLKKMIERESERKIGDRTRKRAGGTRRKY